MWNGGLQLTGLDLINSISAPFHRELDGLATLTLGARSAANKRMAGDAEGAVHEERIELPEELQDDDAAESDGYSLFNAALVEIGVCSCLSLARQRHTRLEQSTRASCTRGAEHSCGL